MNQPRFRAVQIGRVAPGVWRVAIRGPLSARPYILEEDCPTWAEAFALGLEMLQARYGVSA